MEPDQKHEIESAGFSLPNNESSKPKTLVQIPLRSTEPTLDFPKIDIPCDENWDNLEFTVSSVDTSETVGTDDLKLENLNLIGMDNKIETLEKTDTNEPVITNTFNDYWSVQALKELNLNPKLILKTDR